MKQIIYITCIDPNSEKYVALLRSRSIISTGHQLQVAGNTFKEASRCESKALPFQGLSYLSTCFSCSTRFSGFSPSGSLSLKYLSRKEF